MDHARTLNDILLKIGGLRLDEALGNFTDSRVVDFLSEYDNSSPSTGLKSARKHHSPTWRKPLDPVQCHRNCADLRVYAPIGLSDYRIVYGWALSDNGLVLSFLVYQEKRTREYYRNNPPEGLVFWICLPDEVHLRYVHCPQHSGRSIGEVPKFYFRLRHEPNVNRELPLRVVI